MKLKVIPLFIPASQLISCKKPTPRKTLVKRLGADCNLLSGSPVCLSVGAACRRTLHIRLFILHFCRCFCAWGSQMCPTFSRCLSIPDKPFFVQQLEPQHLVLRCDLASSESRSTRTDVQIIDTFLSTNSTSFSLLRPFHPQKGCLSWVGPSKI